MDPVTSEIYARLRWFIKLRWIAIFSIIVTAVTLEHLFGQHLMTVPMQIIILGMVSCNMFFKWLVNIIPVTHTGNHKLVLSPSGFANLQIGLDLFFLTVMWQIYGGVENPIMFFFVFHMIIASILLSKLNSFLWAIVSSILLMLVAVLEYHGVLIHHPLMFKITGVELWNNLYWTLFVLSAFCFTLILVVYMTSSITSRLKARNEEIIRLEKEIADRKLQETEKKLFFSEKMAALGKLAAGMAHEINNPLTTILSYSECLQDELIENKSQNEDIKTIINETIRIRGIVKEILNFARAGDQTETTPVDLNSEILEIVDMLQLQMNFINVLFKLNLGKNLPRIGVGKEHLKQVLINLLVNAAQAMTEKGTITLETSVDKKESNVLLKCSDTGLGIPQEILTRIFDPFFTTKKQGLGTGLGLSVSYGLIKMYEGNIRVESEPGKGATFILSLPVEA